MRVTSQIAALALALIAAAAARAGDAWTSLGGPPEGRVLDFASEAGVVYAAVEDRVARSTDGGATWELLTGSAVFHSGEEQPVVERIASIGGTVVASASSGAVARSTDGGATWEAVTLPVAIRSVADFLVDQGRLYALVADAVPGESSWLLVSHDEGATWAPVTRGLGSIFAEGDLLLGGAGAAEIRRSTDGGATWETKTYAEAGIDLSLAILRHFTRVDGAMFLSATDGFFGTPKSVIFRSLDNGQSWHRASLPPGAIRIVTGMQAVGGTLLATAVEHGFETAVCWASQNAGASWQARGGVTPGRDMVFHATAQGLLGAAQSRVHRSTDGGFTWTLAHDGLPFSWASELAAVGDAVIAGSLFAQELYRFAQGQWSRIQLPGTDRPNTLDLLVTGGGAVFAGTEADGVFRSSDGGLTWAAVNAGVPQYNGSAGLQFREIEAMTESGGTLFAGTGPGIEVISGQFVITAGGILRSTDGGASWQTVNTGLPVQGHNNFGVPFYDMVLSMAAGDGVVYAGMGITGLFRSTNNGSSWHLVSTGLSGSVSWLAASGDTVLAVTQDPVTGQRAARSLDRGETWTEIGGVPSPLSDLEFADGRLLASTRFVPFNDSGVFESTDGGLSWTPVGGPVGGYSVAAIAAAGDRVYAGTQRGGVWVYGDECPADYDGDGAVNSADISAFLTAWLVSVQTGTLGADFNGDQSVNSSDISAFLAAWLDAVQGGC